MTLALSGEELAAKLGQRFPGSIIKSTKDSITVTPESLTTLAAYLKTEPGYEFDFLCSVTAIDYRDKYELVYQLTSIKHNLSLVLKTQCTDRANPVVPTLVGLWQGADFQEREAYDLFGINFTGHPNMKPIFLWEGFKGHPLRKDFTDGA